MRVRESLRDYKCVSNANPALKCRAIGKRRSAAPQGLKPPSHADLFGTAEAVPFPSETFAASFILQVRTSTGAVPAGLGQVCLPTQH